MMTKKLYTVPMTVCVMAIDTEPIMLKLSNMGDGNWAQYGVGDGDPDDGTEDDGRANTFIWDEMDDRLIGL